MAASPARDRPSASGLLSIGQVLARLTGEFPDISASKLRYLEDKGIVTPSRTDSGYRKFSGDDVERLRLALTLQRDHYMPLDVIRERLDAAERSGEPAATLLAPPPSITPPARSYLREEMLAAAGAGHQLLNDAISTGVITAVDRYSEQTVALLRSLVALNRHGIEPRHLRSVRQSAEREVALIESALSPLIRRTDAASRGRAAEVAPELAATIDDVRAVFVKEALARALT